MSRGATVCWTDRFGHIQREIPEDVPGHAWELREWDFRSDSWRGVRVFDRVAEAVSYARARGLPLTPDALIQVPKP